MRFFGYALFFSGICGGAVVAVYPRIPWLRFLPAVGIALVGVILVRIQARGKPNGLREKMGGGDLLEKLGRINRKTSALAETTSWPDADAVKESVEEVETMIAEVTANPQAQTAELGYEAFSRIFTPLAQGERNIHRAWSALVDGYMREARTALHVASLLFRQAFDEARKLESETRPGMPGRAGRREPILF